LEVIILRAIQERSINRIGLTLAIDNGEFEFRTNGERPFAKARLFNQMLQGSQTLGQPLPKTRKFFFVKLVAING
jgi:hypothetical protein